MLNSWRRSGSWEEEEEGKEVQVVGGYIGFLEEKKDLKKKKKRGVN